MTTTDTYAWYDAIDLPGNHELRGHRGHDKTARFDLYSDNDLVLGNADWPTTYTALCGLGLKVDETVEALRSVLPPVSYGA